MYSALSLICSTSLVGGVPCFSVELLLFSASGRALAAALCIPHLLEKQRICPARDGTAEGSNCWSQRARTPEDEFIGGKAREFRSPQRKRVDAMTPYRDLKASFLQEVR